MIAPKLPEVKQWRKLPLSLIRELGPKLMVLSAIESYGAECFARLEHIAARAGCSVSQAKRHRAALEKDGWVESIKSERRTKSVRLTEKARRCWEGEFLAASIDADLSWYQLLVLAEIERNPGAEAGEWLLYRSFSHIAERAGLGMDRTSSVRDALQKLFDSRRIELEIAEGIRVRTLADVPRENAPFFADVPRENAPFFADMPRESAPPNRQNAPPDPAKMRPLPRENAPPNRGNAPPEVSENTALAAIFMPRNDTAKTANSTINNTYEEHNRNSILKSTARASFTRPTVDEVREYCESRDNNVDPQAFIDFYDSKGWLIGKNPMKDWKAAVRTWEARRREEAAKAPQFKSKQQLLEENNAKVFEKVFGFKNSKVVYAQ